MKLTWDQIRTRAVALTMPPELRKAHQHNDRAVLFAYGMKADTSEAEIVAALMERYRKMVEG